MHEYLVDFPGKQDVLRYVLTANAPETKDNDFTWKDFQARNNNELVAVYGNFVNRALQLTKKYFDSVVPAAGELNDYDRETLKEFADVKAEVEKLLEDAGIQLAQYVACPKVQEKKGTTEIIAIALVFRGWDLVKFKQIS